MFDHPTQDLPICSDRCDGEAECIDGHCMVVVTVPEAPAERDEEGKSLFCYSLYWIGKASAVPVATLISLN